MLMFLQNYFRDTSTISPFSSNFMSEIYSISSRSVFKGSWVVLNVKVRERRLLSLITNCTSYQRPRVSSTSDRNFSFSEGDHGYVIYNYKMNWEDKMYTKPIPTTALNVNHDILQNDGWQWN